MLIRVSEEQLREFPDNLAALILADPLCSDEECDFSVEDVNLLVHGIVGTHYDFSLSYESNIEKIEALYNSMGEPNNQTYLAAQTAVDLYNQTVEVNEIGLVDKSLIFSSNSPANDKLIS